MDKKAILQALKERKITPEEAKRLLSGGAPAAEIEKPRTEAIAVIGMSGRLPGSSDADTFWENLRTGKDCVTKVPASRWDMSKYFDPEIGKKGHIYCDRIGAVEGAELFDPRFFGITPAEAAEMDPQHRLFLEEAYAAFEDAGYSRRLLDGQRCGVYFGVVDDDYTTLGETTLSATGNSNAVGAARIAYFLNLKGPAVAVDTACSSAMVGLHLAINALRLNEIDMAVAGGACLYLTPESYISMCEAGMLSPRGQCRTFDNDADGFVPGEGAAALVLKRLSDAERDHDHIYGLIIASGMNQDGRTNGITAPNMGSQQMLESQVYAQYGIDPETITYAEFHGTGTKLGDPIEMGALTAAFREKTEKRNFCAVGALKSNTGHTSAVSGVAGIEKILLCMQHRELVPTLHVETPNEHFDMERSPFYINTENKPWTAPGKLRACISSFGFSGTNVHAVLEEYRFTHPQNEDKIEKRPNLFVLSARSAERLKVYAKNIVNRLEKGLENEDDFFYTMQTGREAFEERLAVVVHGAKDLADQLSRFVNGEEGTGILRSRLSRNQIKSKEAVWEAAHKNVAAPEKNLSRTEETLNALAEQWLNGEIIVWDALYEHKPYRMKLPVYPFEEVPCWLSQAKPDADLSALQKTAALHPLVQENVSDFSGQKYQSVFTGNEFFLRDHVVGGEKILPATAVMEMARAAAELALQKRVTELKQLIWLRAIVPSPETKVQIRLLPLQGEEKSAGFEVYTVEEGKEPVLCAQGCASAAEPLSMKTISVHEIESRCVMAIQGTQLYGQIRGIAYGPTFRAVQSVKCGDNEAVSALYMAKEAEEKRFILNPALMDAAMQTVSVLMSGASDGTWLPFSAEDVKIYGAMPAECRAVARKRPGTEATFDVDVCSMQGQAMIRLSGLYLKNVHTKSLCCFTPAWEEKALPQDDAKLDRDTAVLLVTGNESLSAAFQAETAKRGIPGFVMGQLPNGADVKAAEDLTKAENWDRTLGALHKLGFASVSLILAEPPVPEKESALFETVLQLSQALFRARFTANTYLSFFGCGAIPKLQENALAGMFRCIGQEIPGFRFRFIWLQDALTAEVCLDIHEKESRVLEPLCEISWRKGVRKALTYRPLKEAENPASPIREGGVYLITGGLGGVGLLTARYVAKTKGVHLYLTGRSPLNPRAEEQLNSLRKSGASCEYLQADVSDKAAMAAAVERIFTDHGHLNGVFHAAGVTRDSLLLNKTAEEARKVLDAKTAGTRVLDETTAKLKPEFFVLYSSNASSLGNIGQADYCYANCYMDHFAAIRNLLVRRKARTGRTISFNWPLWKNGGMRIDAETQEWMRRELGIETMDDAEGFRALEWGMQSDSSQVMVFTGSAEKVRRVLEAGRQVRKIEDTAEAPSAPAQKEEGAPKAEENERDSALAYFTNFVAQATGLGVEELDEETSFGDYGIDSIQLLSMTRSLEKDFGALSKTLFFEHGSIGALTEYFLNEHSVKLAEKLRPAQPEIAAPSVQPEKQDEPTITNEVVPQETIPCAETVSDDIAVIGLDGKYPMADDLGEMWDNLTAGRDCIEEVPKDRWDMDAYFDENKHRPGKSYSKWGGFLRDVDKFDPMFFSITPVEAEFLDPQSRLFLESSWHAMEDAGYTREALADSRVGVYVGVMYGMYQLLNGQLGDAVVPASSSYAAIPNRVSYFFNFRGPSIAVDTMCSSSLTALHLACEDLKHGKTDLAFVGGVNLSIHPNKYLLLSYGGFAASDGRCRTFGEGGDGYVPGEGVGTVILKPLKKALADGDQIYGVIRGTAVNSGGKTTGFTVPSPTAQCQVIQEAMREARTAPETISYIEAHGTGTSLGDPIEIEGLNRAFGGSLPQGSCAIGSLKSNIGHLEAAAGIAGLTKVLLQIKHGKLVPSLHSETLNPMIDFEKGPFRVQHKTEDWQGMIVTENGKTRMVRRAGISCFGAGGSNAHVIVEDYPSVKLAAETEKKEYLFVFSARTREQLGDAVARFLAFLSGPEGKNVSAAQAAYVLETGREAMACRLLAKAKNLSELSQMLYAWQQNEKNIPGLWEGNVLDSREALKERRNSLRAAGTLDRLAAEGTAEEIANYWIAGGKVDWAKAWPVKPVRCSLPGYPFAKERYWVKEPEIKASADFAQISSLLHRNTSDIYGLRFTSFFTGKEAFLRDHQVFGSPLMPAAAFVEMARAAVEQLTPASRGTISLRNMTWQRPARIPSGGLTIETRVEIEDETTFRLSFRDGRDESAVFCRGTAEIKKENRPSVCDLSALRKRLTVQPANRDELYRRFAETGIVYGQTMQAIQELYTDGKEVLARLRLNSEKGNGVWLPPAMLDGCLQAAAGFNLSAGSEANAKEEARLPFTFDRLAIYEESGEEGWAWLNLGGEMDSTAPAKINMTLLHGDGTVFAQITNMIYRSGKQTETASRTMNESELYIPTWKEEQLP